MTKYDVDMDWFPTPTEYLPIEGTESGVETAVHREGSELQGSGPSPFITGVLARLQATDIRCFGTLTATGLRKRAFGVLGGSSWIE